MGVRVHRSVRRVFWELASLDLYLNVYSHGISFISSIKISLLESQKFFLHYCGAGKQIISTDKKKKGMIRGKMKKNV